MEHHAQSLEGVHPDPEAGGVDRRRFLAQLAAAGLTASAAEALFAGATANAAVAAGSTLRLRANFDIQNTDPAFWPTHIDEWIALCSMEGLLSFRPGTFNNVNCLAQSLETSKDGLSIHFKLQAGRGVPRRLRRDDLDDVKYSYERIAGLTKPNIHAVYQGDWNALRQRQDQGQVSGHDHPQATVRTARPQHHARRGRAGHVQEGRREAGQEIRPGRRRGCSAS